MAADTTTVRMATTTRDRLMKVATGEETTVDQMVNKLLDEHWKAQFIADWDRIRAEDPHGWREVMEENEQWDRLSPNLNETEGPYRSDDPDWIAAGGLPLTEDKDVA